MTPVEFAFGPVRGWQRPATGPGETVVLLHGVNGTATEWEALAAATAPRWRIVAVDLPRHGREADAASAPRVPFDLDACVCAVVAVLDELAGDPVHLVGSSFGGGVALAVAARHPALVRTVTTIGTGPGGETEAFASISSALSARGPASFFRATIPVFSYPPGTDERIVEEAVERAAARELDDALALLQTAFCTELAPVARAVTAPRLILGGAEDRTTDPERVRALADAAGTAAWILPGAGHLPHIEQPARLAGLLSAFWSAPVEPRRTTADLDTLLRLTATDEGSQRVAWTPVWESARELFRDSVAAIPGVRFHRDAAGNSHATLPGRSDGVLAIGSHLDSVPDGGNLDGGYGVMAALEVLRALAERPEPPALTVRVTDWADEEGARFGRSLFGSAAVAGTLDVEELKRLRDRAGADPVQVLGEHGIDLDRIHEARDTVSGLVSYLELHIEQGPVLDAAGEALAAVTGSLGVERHLVTLSGSPGHAGSPLELRHDPVQAAAAFLTSARRIAVEHRGRVTCGILQAEPATPTAVPDTVDFSLDVRHDDPRALTALWRELRSELETLCGAEGVTSRVQELWSTPPVRFDAALVEEAAALVRAMTGDERRLVSGPLHDACEMAGAGIPTVMMFVPSIEGVSHAPRERTAVEHLELGVRALAALTVRVLDAVEAP